MAAAKRFLSSLLSNAEHDKDKTKVAKLKAILQAEYMKKLWPKLRKYAKGETCSGLDRVEIPTHDSDETKSEKHFLKVRDFEEHVYFQFKSKNQRTFIRPIKSKPYKQK